MDEENNKEELNEEEASFDFNVELEEDASTTPLNIKEEHPIPINPVRPPSEWDHDAFKISQDELERDSRIEYDVDTPEEEQKEPLPYAIQESQAEEPTSETSKKKKEKPSVINNLAALVSKKRKELSQKLKEDEIKREEKRRRKRLQQAEAKALKEQENDPPQEPTKQKERLGLPEALVETHEAEEVELPTLDKDTDTTEGTQEMPPLPTIPLPSEISEPPLPSPEEYNKEVNLKEEPSLSQKTNKEIIEKEEKKKQKELEAFQKEEEKERLKQEKQEEKERKKKEKEEKKRESIENKEIKKREASRVKQEKRRIKARQEEEKKRNKEEEKERKKIISKQEKERKKQEKENKKAKAKAPKPVKQPGDNLLWIPFVGKSLAEKAKLKALEKANKPKKEEKKDVFQGLKDAINKRRAKRARIRASNIVGLDIGASELRAALLSDGYPLSMATHPLPEGVIVDGQLQEPEILSDELKRFWQASGFKSKTVNFSLTNRLVTLRTKDIAAEHEEDIEQAVTMISSSLIAPMNPDDSIIDYAEMSRIGAQTSLQIAAADENMVKDYTRAVERAGLLAASCEIGPLAMSRALVVPRRPDKAHVLIDIGAETTSFVVANGPDVLYLRVLEIGGNDFTRAIEDKLEISFKEAEETKKGSGFGVQPVSNTLDQATFSQVQEAMLSVSDTLHQELMQTKQFYENNSNGLSIDSYSLLGGGSLLPGLDEQISLFVGLPHKEELRPYPKLEEADNLLLNASALGLARAQTMSLLPEIEARSFNVSLPGTRSRSKLSTNKKKAEKQAKRLTKNRSKQETSPKLIGLLIAVAILAGGWFGQKEFEKQNTALETEIQTAKQAVKEQAEQVPSPSYNASGESREKLNLLAAELTSSPNYKTLEELIPLFDKEKVTNIQITSQGANIVIEGSVADSDSVNTLADAISSKASIEEVTSSKNNVSQGSQDFSLTLDFLQPGEDK